MAKKLGYFCWYPADFDVDENVKLMNIEEIGLYAVCLNHAWVNGSLPADPLEIARAMKVPKAQFLRAWPRVAPCFREREDGRRTNPRQEKERQQALDRHESKKKGGESTAAKRWGSKLHSDSLANSSATSRAYDSVYDSDATFVDVSEKPKPEVSLAAGSAKIDGQPIFERLIGAFLAAGVKLSDQRLREAGFEWVSLPDSEWEPAARLAEARAKSTDAKHMGWPSNFLKRRDWAAWGPGRVLPIPRDPTKFEKANAEALAKVQGGRSF